VLGQLLLLRADFLLEHWREREELRDETELYEYCVSFVVSKHIKDGV